MTDDLGQQGRGRLRGQPAQRHHLGSGNRYARARRDHRCGALEERDELPSLRRCEFEIVEHDEEPHRGQRVDDLVVRCLGPRLWDCDRVVQGLYDIARCESAAANGEDSIGALVGARCVGEVSEQRSLSDPAFAHDMKDGTRRNRVLDLGELDLSIEQSDRVRPLYHGRGAQRDADWCRQLGHIGSVERAKHKDARADSYLAAAGRFGGVRIFHEPYQP